MNEPIEKNAPVEVAAAVLLRPDGSFLLAQRPVGKIWAGYWEFPGGKVEVGESAYHALLRELQEELGIAVETAYPWITRVFTYPHATVRLNFFRVTAWRGELHPHEGQAFSWQQPLPAASAGDVSRLVTVEPMLPANAPVLRALALPAWYAISNAAELGAEEFLRRLEIALRKGLRLMQLREKNLSRNELEDLLQRVLALSRAYGARVLLNGDIELALDAGADGVHLSGEQLRACGGRPDVEWCAASCHDAEELCRAQQLGCDFAVLSPVLPTQSHPGAAHLGWEAFARCAAGASIPVYALGGLSLADMPTAWRHGAHGVALLRQAWPEDSSG